MEDFVKGLDIAIEKKTNTILKEAQEYYDERAELLEAHSQLWDKLWDNMNATQKKWIIKEENTEKLQEIMAQNAYIWEKVYESDIIK